MAKRKWSNITDRAGDTELPASGQNSAPQRRLAILPLHPPPAPRETARAMSEENVEIVRRLYDAVGRGDTDAVLALYDPEVEWDFARSPFRDFVKHKIYRGHSGVRDLIRERYDDAWETVTDELEELIDADPHVISIIKSHGRGRRSGASAEMTHAGVWTIRGGRIVRVEWMSRDDALKAAGLSE